MDALQGGGERWEGGIIYVFGCDACGGVCGFIWAVGLRTGEYDGSVHGRGEEGVGDGPAEAARGATGDGDKDHDDTWDGLTGTGQQLSTESQRGRIQFVSCVVEQKAILQL